MVDELVDAGIVQPSQSNYSSPAILVEKADGEHRLCIDYRALQLKFSTLWITSMINVSWTGSKWSVLFFYRDVLINRTCDNGVLKIRKHSQRVTVWCTLSRVGIIGSQFFEEDDRVVSVTSHRCVKMITSK